MKKILRFMLVCLLVMSLGACSNTSGDESDRYAFEATILNDYGQMVVVQVAQDDPLHASFARITFNTASLEDIGAEVGDRVRVVYDGQVLETEPGQVTAKSWSLIEKAGEEGPEKDPDQGTEPVVTTEGPEKTDVEKDPDRSREENTTREEDPKPPVVDPIYKTVPGLSLHYNGAVYTAENNGSSWAFQEGDTVSKTQNDWTHPLLNMALWPTIEYTVNEMMLLQFDLSPDIVTVTAWEKDAVFSEDPSAVMSHVMTLAGAELPLLGEGSWLYEIHATWNSGDLPCTGEAWYCFVVINEEPTEEIITFDASLNGSGSVTASLVPLEGSDLWKLSITGRGEMLHGANGSMPWHEYAAAIGAVSVEEGIVTLGSGTFRGLSELTAVTLPESLTTIHEEAFAGCGKLAAIKIPDGVRILKDNVFLNCASLTSIEWQGQFYPTVDDFLTAFRAAETGGMTGDEIQALYDRAVEVYGWFDLATLPATGEKTVTVDEQLYYLVTDPEINTMAALQAAVRGIFGPDLSEKLLEPKDPAQLRYIEMNDKLYTVMADRGTNIHRGQEEITWTYESTERISVTVRVEELAEDLTTVKGYVRHTFSLERIEGSWVFTEFEMVR